MMGTWYGTLLMSEYGITILILMVYGAFHGYFITWWLYMLYDWVYVVYSSDYSFLNIVSAKLLGMIYICWTWGKVGFCEMFLNGETLKEWTGDYERRNLCK